MAPSVFMRAGLWALTLAACAYAASAPAQSDLSGSWEITGYQDRLIDGVGSYPSEFMGVPFNENGRAAAQSYNPTEIEELQRQCQPYLAYYITHGPSAPRISVTTDPITGAPAALHLSGLVDRMPMTIWLDGRSPPSPRALHTFDGFTVGTWRGNTLMTTTTNIKGGFNRTGTRASNQGTMRVFWRRHGNLLTLTAIIRDPVYLSHPYVVSKIWRLGGARFPATYCTPVNSIPGLSDGYHWATYLPGENPNLSYMKTHYNIPLDAVFGGAETMYPEFRKKLAREYTVPSGYCSAYCCGVGGPPAPPSVVEYNREVLRCKDETQSGEL